MVVIFMEHIDEPNQDSEDESLVKHVKFLHKGLITTSKEEFTTKTAIYGNYPSYYGYRVGIQYDDIRLVLFKEYFPHLFENKRILDVGCNVGAMTLNIGRYMKPEHIIGIDIDSTLIKKARHQLQFYYSLQKPHILNEMNTEIDECTFNHDRDSYNYFPISMPIVFGYVPMVCNDSHKSFPMNVNFRCKNWIDIRESFKDSVDTILCLSITKWIHLNWGDYGILTLFKRAYEEIKPGGILVLESQSLSSYYKNHHLTEIHKRHYNEMKIFPEMFLQILFQTGFIACVRVFPEQKRYHNCNIKDNHTFKRPIYFLKKAPNVNDIQNK